MKNIIYIDSLHDCRCDLISNINDGTNKLVLEIKSDVSKKPRLEIGSTTVNITSDDFLFDVPYSNFVGSGDLEFRIIDSEHTGDYFKVQKVLSLDANLFLKQESNFSYVLSLVGEPEEFYTKLEVDSKLGKYVLKSDLSYTHYDSRDGSTFQKDFLKIGGTLNNPVQKSAYFVKSKEDSDWENAPSQLAEGTWIGFRRVLVPNSVHFLVEITELLPVPGRIWTNYYRKDLSTWGGWKSISPQ